MIIINTFKRYINWIINKINVLWIKETFNIMIFINEIIKEKIDKEIINILIEFKE